MAPWGLLDEKSESEIHKSRLLNVEERPFKRITKRLGTIFTLTSSPSLTEISPEANAATNHEQTKEDLTLDFAAFDSTITRLQFLYNANIRERERYQADQQRILGECHDVRSNNAELKEQLEEARATLAQRKKFDQLADKITSNKLLKPREEQKASLAKLEEECRELERESETYSETWKERRDQFNKIMEEGMLLRRQIRDEKEEVDRREGMIEDADEDEGGAERGGAGTPRPEVGTPRPEVGASGQQQSTTGTGSNKGDGELGSSRLRPVPDEGGSTPTQAALDPEAAGAEDHQYPASQSVTREGTPLPAAANEGDKKEEEDTDMDESHQSGKATDVESGTPRPATEGPEESKGTSDKMEVDS